ncbi:ZIP family metal transporter [Halospeciosus flavus]|uniref:ZIP family metal transporter n=1 Tax=Halospeciosus flavus TaxID=3032283 RepID=A0ABD5Z1E7_9EURY|nr:ZIP family metal transporter [Halospeciosus flavus]
MTDTLDQSVDTAEGRRALHLGWASVLALVVLSGLAVAAGVGVKLLGISWVAFVAMVSGAVLGKRGSVEHAGGLVWGYGLASGAMITSAAAFIVPGAIGHHPAFGGFGIAAGVVTGFAGHTVGHRLAHRDLPLDNTAAAITAHALTAGLIIGVVYTGMPELGPLLGLAIVSHKGPAGYAAARRLVRNGRTPAMLLLPAAAVGLAALGVALLGPAVQSFLSTPLVRALVFGFAAGIFLHVAMDFLPRCEIGSEVHEVVKTDGDAHEVLDRLRIHAVGSTVLGGAAVFTVWLVLGGA